MIDVDVQIQKHERVITLSSQISRHAGIVLGLRNLVKHHEDHPEIMNDCGSYVRLLKRKIEMRLFQIESIKQQINYL